MIFIKSFKNYEEFKKLFAIVEHGNGAKSRKNKILLAWLKDRRFLKAWLSFQRTMLNKGLVAEEFVYKYDYLNARSMDDVKKAVLRISESFAAYHFDGGQPQWMENCGLFVLNDWPLRHRTLYIDSRHGLCADGDTKSVRYINSERGDRVFKMKAGKFITSCLDSLPFTEILPEQVKRWIGEEFARDWQVYAESLIGESALTLHVGSDKSDFETIYDKNLYKGDFHSCMGGEDQYFFYADAVDASAAWLTDSDGMIVARCVIFNDVIDEEGKSWRLAERQYSSDMDEVLKQTLVNRLIKEGLIDGYKRVGVDCHDNRNFVANNGESLRAKRFSIECRLCDGDTLSYQDSFACYDYNKDIAYNHSDVYYTDKLDVTDHHFYSSHDNERWSDYSQEWIADNVAEYDDYHEDWMHEDCSTDAIYNGHHIHINEYRTNDFVWSEEEDCYIYEDEAVWVENLNDDILRRNAVEDIHGEWQRANDCVHSAYHDEYILKEDAIYSEVLEDWFEDEDTMHEAEKEELEVEA
jgi:hypothetical protein